MRSSVILLADDDPAILALTELILNGQGYTVVTAKDGADALRVFRVCERRFDLLISGVIMPGVSGPELMEMLVGPGLISRGLLISANPRAADLRVLEQRIGIDVPLLPKPFFPLDLVVKVEQLLGDDLREERDSGTAKGAGSRSEGSVANREGAASMEGSGPACQEAMPDLPDNIAFG